MKNCLRATTHRDGSQEPLGHVSHDDTNQENHRFQKPVVLNVGNDEKRNSKHYSHTGDDVNEVLNLDSNRSLAMPQAAGQDSNSTHDGLVSCLNSDSLARSLQAICGEEGQVPCLNWVFMCAFWTTTLRLGLSSQ